MPTENNNYMSYLGRLYDFQPIAFTPYFYGSSTTASTDDSVYYVKFDYGSFFDPFKKQSKEYEIE